MQQDGVKIAKQHQSISERSPATLLRKDREKYQHSSNGSNGSPQHLEQDLNYLQYFSVLPTAAGFQQI